MPPDLKISLTELLATSLNLTLLPPLCSPRSAAPPHMGNRYFIPDLTKQHIFTQAISRRQNTVASAFGVSTKTVKRVIKNVRDYGTVSRQPLTVGRRRELSWGDITVSQLWYPNSQG